MRKTIKFRASKQVFNAIEDPVVPAYQKIPKWFKDIPSTNHPMRLGRSASTVKKCVPFIDALSAGYIVTAPSDIAIKIIDGVQRTQSFVGIQDPLLEGDEPHRTEGMPVPKGYGTTILRALVHPTVITPPDYSVLVTHPFNRYDLPFLTLSGIIDSDNLHIPLSVNLYLRDDFEGIIEKGTPLAQVMPFKRTDWDHKLLPHDSDAEEKTSWKLYSKIDRSYQLQFWSKKTYK